MANQNFVVHNGLTVGQFIVDATTSNISLPPTKQLAIGNVILRDNGDGKLHIRDITDNSDAELIGTVGAVSTTSGNIQIGTNHIESTNPNGPISLRPNGNGNIAFSSNTIMIGHGGAFTLVGTGIQTDEFYGINYPGTNIIVTLSSINSSGNLRLSMTTPATSTSTGALQVSGGVGVVGSLYVGGGIGAGGTLGSSGQVLQSTGTGVQWSSADNIQSGASNVTVIASWVNVNVISQSIASFGSLNANTIIHNSLIVEGNLFVNGTTTTINANNLSISDAMIYLADDNPADALDIGFVSSFTNPGYQHTGFVRDATDGIWKLFANVVPEPTTVINFSSANYSSMLVGNIQTTGWGNIGSSINVGGNVLAKIGTFNEIDLNGYLNSTGNILATGGVLNTLTINGTTNTRDVIPTASNTYSVGSTTLWYSSFWGAAVNARYADLAERYLADAEYEPGTVLMFGGEQEVTECAHDLCTRVAGVVSTNPAYLMNHQLEGDNIVDLALTGRVPTKVTGTVRKGDMMVSAGNGRARAEDNPRVGSVIGKALENSEGDVVIEVVVGKH